MDEAELYGYEEDEILILEFESGEEEKCGIMGIFDASERTYIALNPLGTGDVYVYGYEEEGDEFILYDNLTEPEFEEAIRTFESLTKAKLEKEQ